MGDDEVVNGKKVDGYMEYYPAEGNIIIYQLVKMSGINKDHYHKFTFVLKKQHFVRLSKNKLDFLEKL